MADVTIPQALTDTILCGTLSAGVGSIVFSNLLIYEATMKLCSVSVEHFRSIKDMREINLESYTVIIGPNNEGKSNILRAIRIAMHEISKNARKTSGYNRNFYENRFGNYMPYREIEEFSPNHDRPINSSKRQKDTIIGLEFSLQQNEIVDFEKTVGSRINGALKVEVRFDVNGKSSIKFIKQGRGSEIFKQKTEIISTFICDRIQFQYIPSVRTAEYAQAHLSQLTGHGARKPLILLGW
jgi:putative ATP-dependent endonuclease of OLD family